MRVTKEFAFLERYRMAVFGEVFNLFNISNLSGFNYTLDAVRTPHLRLRPSHRPHQPGVRFRRTALDSARGAVFVLIHCDSLLQGPAMKKLTVLTVLIAAALTLLGADLTGTWSASVVLDAGSGTATFVFKQTGEALSGTYTGTFGQAPLTGNGKEVLT